MPKRVSFEDLPQAELKSGVTTSLVVPDGFDCRSLTASVLSYPVEIIALANWDIPPTLRKNSTVPSRARAWPRVDTMPKGGELLWLLRGNIEFDYSVYPGRTGWFNPQSATYLAPPNRPEGSDAADGSTQVHPTGLDESERIQDAWPETDMWTRIMPLLDKAGQQPEQPSYLLSYAFVKAGQNDSGNLSSILESIEISYR